MCSPTPAPRAKAASRSAVRASIQVLNGVASPSCVTVCRSAAHRARPSFRRSIRSPSATWRCSRVPTDCATGRHRWAGRSISSARPGVPPARRWPCALRSAASPPSAAILRCPAIAAMSITGAGSPASPATATANTARCAASMATATSVGGCRTLSRRGSMSPRCRTISSWRAPCASPMPSPIRAPRAAR